MYCVSYYVNATGLQVHLTHVEAFVTRETQWWSDWVKNLLYSSIFDIKNKVQIVGKIVLVSLFNLHHWKENFLGCLMHF